MTKNAIWGAPSREQMTKSDRATCPVAGEHLGPLIAVAGDGNSTSMMCVHHAMAWSESNLCRDVAEHNSSAFLALSLWVSSGSAQASAAA